VNVLKGNLMLASCGTGGLEASWYLNSVTVSVSSSAMAITFFGLSLKNCLYLFFDTCHFFPKISIHVFDDVLYLPVK
jgi:hypothetical protein